ncbi:hypothetical protein B566_EDAN016097 [Ephemera danica]|nr:hypothetical protein B566_EDAN016097 [Ephemera danica]
MPPTGKRGAAEATAFVDKLIQENQVMVFSKSFCPFCDKVKALFKEINQTFESLELDTLGEWGTELQEALVTKTKQRTVPNVFVKQRHIGGCDATLAYQQSGQLKELLEGPVYDYDLAVIGGGSGGLAAAKEAARLGRKVVVFDFVKPSPQSTTWGLGGTCVNVGCIPKKLMHKAAIVGTDMRDAPSFGYQPVEIKHDWGNMVQEIQMYIKSLNFKYRAQLVQKGITYVNGYAKFVDQHTLSVEDKKGKVSQCTANHFIIAVGGRPKYPDIPGAREYGITSDDLFSLRYPPGETLIVGASYIALECAGFLAGLGHNVTVMVRSILLRGFDQQMASLIGDNMEKSHNVSFIRECVPTKVEKLETDDAGANKLRSGEEHVGTYNTVIFAVGREACTQTMGLDAVNLKVNPSDNKIIADLQDNTAAENIFAVGDVVQGMPELTPRLYANSKEMRLYANSKEMVSLQNVPTTVFTPLEYGCVGLSEEAAIEKYGADNIEVYHTHFQPLEYELPKKEINMSYAKLICNKLDDMAAVSVEGHGSMPSTQLQLSYECPRVCEPSLRLV